MKDEMTISFNHINFYFIIRNILRFLWIPVLLAVSAWLLLTAGETMLFHPEYRSSAILVVSSKGGTSAYSSLKTTKEMTQVFAEVFQSDVLREKVAEELGVSKLNGSISTEVIPETNLLQLNVTSDTPETSFKTLHSILKHYTNVSDYLFSNAVLEQIKPPSVPTKPCNQFISESQKALISVAAALLGIVGIFLLTIWDDTIQTAAAAKDMIDGKLCAMIPYVKIKKRSRKKDANASILITNPKTDFSYIEAFQNFSTMLDHRMKKHQHQVLLISSSLENEGKSTVSANLALTLADRNKKVLLIDCDFRKPSQYKIFDIHDHIKQEFSDYLLSDKKKQEYQPTKFKSIDLALSKSNTEKAVKLVHSERLAEYIEKMRAHYDYILLDSAPMIISDTEALVNLCDTSLLIVRQGYSLVGDINDCLDKLNSTHSTRGYLLNYYRTLGKGKDPKHMISNRNPSIHPTN